MRQYVFALIGLVFVRAMLLLADRYPDPLQSSPHGGMPMASIGEVLGRL